MSIRRTPLLISSFVLYEFYLFKKADKVLTKPPPLHHLRIYLRAENTTVNKVHAPASIDSLRDVFSDRFCLTIQSPAINTPITRAPAITRRPSLRVETIFPVVISNT